MPSFNFSSSTGIPSILITGYVIYFLVYWFVLINVLKRPDFDTAQRILWFLVITMAPIIGLVAFWYVACSPKVYVRPHQPPTSDDTR